MPELPEVETVVRDLRPLLVGRSFVSLIVGKKALRRKWSRAWENQIVGRRVEGIERRGKWLLIGLGKPWLCVHLGMTGQFTVTNGPRETHTHFIWQLDDANELRFRDVRRFGSVTFYPDREALDRFFIESELGPEPFDLDAKYWRDTLKRSRRNLKAILLDQTIIAGVGNIYADESLFEARLHPTSLGTNLKPKNAEMLRQAIASVLTRAIQGRGSTIRDYVGGSGLQGGFQNEFRVYGRTGEACVHCKKPIERIVLAGRSTHFCPRCQRKRN